MEYKVNLEKFSGPLDVLLSLIEEKKLEISEISLAQATDQFLEYFEKLQESASSGSESKLSTDYHRILADFLVVLSRLILIKSRALLPNLVLTNEEEGDIKELEDRLKAYQQIKILGRELGKWAKGRSAYYSRESYLNLSPVFYPPENIQAADFAKIYEKFLKTLPPVEKLEEQSVKRVITLDQKIQELKNRINAAVESSFADISDGAKNKIDVILNFLAVLALFRSRILELSQEELFGDIKIKQRSQILKI
ncbi:segregation/condensation protein A [Candidatus Wolfebacteria bacterium]|nr:segregation/condensation protein A [Candidatus Wolfebacteria bacterium]